MKKVLIVLTVVLVLISCETVEPRHRGVEVGWGGETNLQKVYSEGLHQGFHWLFDDLVNYDVGEKTEVQKFTFNDKNNMQTGVELSLDYNLAPDKVNLIHAKIGKNNIDIKILKTLKSAAKEVVPQYTASELNLTKRNEAEDKISQILAKELPEFYVDFARVQLTDVDIPGKIAQAAEATARQQEFNKLALEKAKESENNFKAAEWDAKTKNILSKPEMLQLKKLEIQEKWIDKWEGSFGTNNVFGSEGTSIIKGLK